MADAFREFVEAELHEIMDSMDERSRKDPERCRRVAIEWIEKNAKIFREQWDENKHCSGYKNN